MYKLLLVDDEEDVREGVFQEIDWNKCGFEVVGKAENGKEALDLVERMPPDVVVTDIKMPFMDGLKLSELVKEKFPTTKIIILSGFDEFEYAHKAVKLHIDEYVLKPFSSQELAEVLVKVKSKIDEEIAEKENITTLKEHYRRSLPVLKEAFLTSLITRKQLQKEVFERCRNYGIDLNGNGFVTGVLSVDSAYSNLSSTEASEKEDVDYSASSLLVDKELTLFAVLNIAEEIVEKHKLGLVFLYNGYVVVIASSPQKENALVLGNVLPAFEEIRLSIEKFLRITITTGIGTVVTDVTQLSYSFEDAVSALDYRLIHGSNRIICIDDVENRFMEKLRFDEMKEHKLIQCLKMGTTEEIKETVESLFEELLDNNISLKDYQVYLLEILTCILKAASNTDIDMDEVFGANYNLLSDIYRFNNLNEAKSRITDRCILVMKCIATDRQSTVKDLVEKAREYTRKHFRESDISINKVCGFLHISTGYFSSLFKKETGMTFVNYLVHIRMEAAKELLRTTDLKAFEIAERVGYSEANYFSYSFKKNFGISPSDYRNSF